MHFRSGRPDEAPLFGEMTIAGVSHWGHDVNFPEAVAGLSADLPTEDFVRDHHFEVLIDDADGEDDIVGFFSLIDRGEHVELYQMFLAVDRIGTGCGRTLWQRATEVAASTHSRMQIMSDPAATGFYAAMGAETLRDIEVSPGFFLSEMWFDLTPLRDAGAP